MKTVTGLFDNYNDASAAVSALEARGVPSDDISIVSNNADNRHKHEDNDNGAAEGAGTGAGIGAVVGGAGGLLTGLGIMAIPGILLIAIIFGGVRSGIFTATESSCIAVLYAFLVAMLVYRELDWHGFVEAVMGAVRTTAMALVGCLR